MANTYTILGSSTVSVATPTITFTNIPATYTDLVLRYSARHDNAFAISQAYFTFNGSSAAEYSEVVLEGNSSVANSGRQSGTDLSYMYLDANNATTNTFSTHEMYIPNYMVSGAKPIQWVGMTENNSGTQNTAMIIANASLWNNTSAISSITITSPSGRNFMVGSSFYLYGVYKGTSATLPSTPTIGTATATGATTATVAFTPTSATNVDASYTALSTPGSITVSGTSSPLAITGLTTGTAYTFQVRANNPGGSSAYSSASNSITPSTAFESIASYVGTGSASSFTFSSIPSTYKHLQIRSISRNTAGGGASENMLVSFNGASSTYWGHFIESAGGSIGSSYWSGSNGIVINRTTQGSAAGANYMGVSIIDIFDYSSTTKKKTLTARTGVEDNNTTYSSVDTVSGFWDGTSAINSITITSDNGRNFNTNSVFALYGIKG